MANGEPLELTANAVRIAVVVANHEQDLATTLHLLTVENNVLDQPLTAELATHKAVSGRKVIQENL